jgi:CheY-like chemotaxis protein
MKENATILLVEDEVNDVFLMQRAARKMNVPILLQIAKDGEEAIDYLSGKDKYADRILYSLPELILLDINMPRKNGFEVLQWMKDDGTLTHIPVVMVTSSKVATDVVKAHQLGAAAYLVKPVEFVELKRLFTETETFLTAHVLERGN